MVKVSGVHWSGDLGRPQGHPLTVFYPILYSAFKWFQGILRAWLLLFLLFLQIPSWCFQVRPSQSSTRSFTWVGKKWYWSRSIIWGALWHNETCVCSCVVTHAVKWIFLKVHPMLKARTGSQDCWVLSQGTWKKIFWGGGKCTRNCDAQRFQSSEPG